MHFLSEISSRRFNHILSILGEKDHCKIDNASGLFMALSVEAIGDADTIPYGYGRLYSFAHYFKQNGDLMADPEVCFFVDKAGRIAPYYVKMDACGYSREEVRLYTGEIRVQPQKQLCSFCGLWLKNIFQQQDLTLSPVNS